MQVEALIDAKTEIVAEEAVQEVRKLIQALVEDIKAAPLVTVSDVQPKRGLFETTYFVSITVDFAVGITSGLITNLIYEYFKSLKKGKLSKNRIDAKDKSDRIEINIAKDKSNRIEINIEEYSITFIISDVDIND